MLLPLYIALALYLTILVYIDFRYRKLPNKVHVVFGVLVLLWYAYLYLVGAIDVIFLRKLFLDSTCALLLGYAMWYFDRLGAGDAKMVYVLSFYMHPINKFAFIPFFPSYTLYVLSFFLALSGLLLDAIKKGKPAFTQAYAKMNILSYLFLSASFMLARSYLVHYMHILLLLPVLYFARGYIEKGVRLLGRKALQVLLTIALATMVVQHPERILSLGFALVLYGLYNLCMEGEQGMSSFAHYIAIACLVLFALS